jgi:hypothetical protein
MKQISTSACETVYDVDGVIIKLWIITGGTPAIDFDTYGFTKRFPAVEKWSDANYLKIENRYKHQERINLQGPTFEVLPNGEQDILDYIKENLPKRDLCLKRANELIDIIKGKNSELYDDGYGMKLESKGKRDVENHTIAKADWCIRPTYISPISVNSMIYGGLVGKIGLFSKWWKEATDLINHLSRSCFYWCDISEEKYQEIKAHIEKFNPKKD